jgi:hydroxyethylthiazole kinase-like uncharacterized protein yjeF
MNEAERSLPEPVTAAQMRAIESAAIASGAVTGGALMERAGAAVVAAMLDRWPDLGSAPRRAVVLCGPGNNGGDGYVIARHLLRRGWTVRVLSQDWAEIGAGRFRPGDAGEAARAWVAAGGSVGPLGAEAIEAEAAGAAGAAVIVDALLGIGQDRPADALLAPLNEALGRLAAAGPPRPRLAAVDVPTGRDADSAAALAAAPVAPDLCVTFHAEKPVHAALRAEGAAVVVADIGLGPWDGHRHDA